MSEVIDVITSGNTVIDVILTGGASVIEIGAPGGVSPGYLLPAYTIQSESGFDVEVGAVPLTNTTGRTLNLRNVKVTFTDEATGLITGQPLIVDVRKVATSIFPQPTLRPTIGVGQSTTSYDFPDVPWLANESLYIDLAQVPTNAGRCKVIVQLWAD